MIKNITEDELIATFALQVSEQAPFRDTYETVKALAKNDGIEPLTMMRVLDVVALHASDNPNTDWMVKYVLTLSDYVDRLVTRFRDHSPDGRRATAERAITNAYLNNKSQHEILKLFGELAEANGNSTKDSYITFNSVHVMRYLFGLRDELTVKIYKKVQEIEEGMENKWLM